MDDTDFPTQKLSDPARPSQPSQPLRPTGPMSASGPLMPSMPLQSQPTSGRSRRRFLRRVVLPGITFVVGVIVGVLIVGLYLFSISGNGQVHVTPVPPKSSDIMVQAGPTYITHLVEKNLRASGMSDVQNVVVTLVSGDQMTIDGDKPVIGFTRHFTILVQPYIEACQLKVNVVHADLGGIPITGFVANFESQINSDLQAKPGTLPSGFDYCKTSVRTDPQGLYITFSAKPV